MPRECTGEVDATPETCGFRHLPFQGTEPPPPPTTDTEGRTLDGGTSRLLPMRPAAPVPPRAWFVASRVQFAAGGGADRPTGMMDEPRACTLAATKELRFLRCSGSHLRRARVSAMADEARG
jgi:hypothetical protein